MELPGARISWFVYLVRLAKGVSDSQRNLVLEELALRGIEAGRYFEPIHLQPAYRDVPLLRAPPPVTESVARRTSRAALFYPDYERPAAGGL